MMLSFSQEEKASQYTTERLFSSCMALIVHQSHPLAAKKQISIKQLQHLPLLLPSGGYSIRKFLDMALQKHNLSPDIKMDVNDINTLLQLVGTGRWATVLMGSSVFNYPQLKAVKITGEGMSRQGTITWPEGTYRKKASLELGKCLIEQAKDYHVEE
jgi:LysR family cyn operon transcriptional activator